jgi:CarD family transcriptional regulator
MMRLIVGRKAIYPSQGLCIIGPVVEKEVAGRLSKFYRLALLDERGGELFVPIEKVGASGLRLLLKRPEVPELLDRLKQTRTTTKDWKQRTNDNLNRLASGSAFALAEIVGSLTELSGTKELSLREEWMLNKAKVLLICEISEVMKEPRSTVELQVDHALNERKIASIVQAPESPAGGKHRRPWRDGPA